MNTRVSKGLVHYPTRALLYLYAFLISFEHGLRDLFGVTTMFEPYRVVGIVLILVIFVRSSQLPFVHVYRDDRFLTGMVLYGAALTVFFLAIGRSINVIGFANDFLLILFNLMVYLSLKRLALTYRDLIILLYWFTAGVVINVLIIINDFYFSANAVRPSAFMDNPNGASFSIMISMLFILSQLWIRSKSFLTLRSIGFALLIFAFVIAVFATGSRTGVLLVAVGVLVFLLSVSAVKNLFQLTVLVSVFVVVYQMSTLFSTASAITTKVYSSRFFYKAQESDEDIRFHLWKGGFNSFVDSNFVGIGMAQFRSNAYYFNKYMEDILPQVVIRRSRDNEAGLGLHSLYVELLVEGGVVSLLLIICFLYRVGFARYRFLMLPYFKSTNAFLFSVFVIIVVSSFTGRGLLSSSFWFAIFLCSQFYVLPFDVKRGRTELAR